MTDQATNDPLVTMEGGASPEPAAAPPPSIDDIMNYDPFAKPAKVEESAGAAAVDGGGQAQPATQPTVDVGAQPAAPPAQPNPTVPGPASEAEFALVKKQLEELQQLRQQDQLVIQRLSQPQGQPAPGTQPAPQQQAQQQELQQLQQLYGGMAVPDDIWQAIQGDDPALARQAFNAMLQGVAMTAHRAVLGVVQQQVVARLPHVVNSTLAERQTQQSVEGDFYGKYPQLNHPALRSFVQSAAMAEMQATGAQAWSEALRDGIAKRVLGELEKLGLGPKAAQAPAAPSAPAPRQPYFTGAAPARAPANGSVDPNSPQGIRSIF